MDFPQFSDIHHLIPQVLDLRPKHTTVCDYHQIEDSDKWEIYIKYRKIVSRFLTDETRSGHLFVDQSCYVTFAGYLLRLLAEDLW